MHAFSPSMDNDTKRSSDNFIIMYDSYSHIWWPQWHALLILSYSPHKKFVFAMKNKCVNVRLKIFYPGQLNLVS